MKTSKKKRIDLGPGDGLLIVDLQNDFCPPDGSLAVPGSDKIVPVVNRLIEHFAARLSLDGEHPGMVAATKDWHEGQHTDYPWPLHCIQGTRGAEFHPGLNYPYGWVFYKGYRGGKGSGYSGFDAVFGREGARMSKAGVRVEVMLYEERTLERELRDAGIHRLFVVGLATNFCVRATVLDALEKGFEVYVICDAIAAVAIDKTKTPDLPTGEEAVQEMEDAGAVLCTSADILNEEGYECEGSEGCECNT